jgi:hypothetical protein
MNTNLTVAHAWKAIIAKHSLTPKQARKLFPRVLAYALDHYKVVRQAVRNELAAAAEKVTAAATWIDMEVAVLMADFDAGAAALLGNAS